MRSSFAVMFLFLVLLMCHNSALAAQPLDAIRDHLVRPNTPMIVGVYVELDKNGPRAPVESVPGNRALSVAANYYAIATLDFSVSLKDIVDYGYWPYNVIPNGTDMQSLIYDMPVTRGLILDDSLSGPILNDIGSSEWTLSAKKDILDSFLSSYYFDLDVSDRADNMDTERIAAFLVNPITGEKMVEGQSRGDYTIVDVNMLRPSFDANSIEYAFTVPQINFNSEMDTSSLESRC